MSHNLHARRKHHQDEGHHHQLPQHGSMDHDNKKSKMSGQAVGAAFFTVGSFLFVGLCLGYLLLHAQHRKVALHVMKHPIAHGKALLKGKVGFRHHFYSGPPRYVTVVLPSVVKPQERRKRLRSIQSTWGPFARSIFVLHNITVFPQATQHHAVISEDSFPGDPYSYPQVLMVPDNIGRDEGVPRLMYVIRSIYERVNPEFAFFVNDHTYVIPEHLCNYLEDLDPTQDLYAGHALKNNMDVFNSGAAGYVLSRSTMRKLVQRWDAKDPNCTMPETGDVSQNEKWLQGNPGLMTTQCLNHSLGITPIDTREDGKYHRFHAFPLSRTVSGKVDSWYKRKHSIEMAHKIGADDSYATLLPGADCCASTTISFHYVEHFEAKAMFATREKLLENPKMTDKELKEVMIAEWPNVKKDLGPYSSPLPKPEHLMGFDGWNELLKVMRKISTRETQRDC